MTDLCSWMKAAEEGWVSVADDELLREAVVQSAGCSGRVFYNRNTGKIVLVDGSDIVMWSGGVWMSSIKPVMK